MDINAVLAKEFETSAQIVANIAGMLDEGNTIPFIARYRKEQTGAMDDTRLRALEERLSRISDSFDVEKNQLDSGI